MLMHSPSGIRHPLRYGHTSIRGATSVHRTNVHKALGATCRYSAGAMRIFDDLRSGLTPAVEELLEGFDRTYSEPPARPRARRRGRESPLPSSRSPWRWRCSCRPSARSTRPSRSRWSAPTRSLAQVRFPIGYGFTVPTQVVFVPMLFLLPGRRRAAARGGRRWCSARCPSTCAASATRAASCSAVGDSWHSVGPGAVLAAAGSPRPSWPTWPVLLAALARADRHRRRRLDPPRVGRARHLAHAPAVAARLGHARGRAAVPGRPAGRDGRRRRALRRAARAAARRPARSSSPPSATRACARRSS